MRGEDLWAELNARGENVEDDGSQLLPDREIDQLSRALPQTRPQDLPGAGQHQTLQVDQGQAQLDKVDEVAAHQQPHQPGLITLYLQLRIIII